MKYVDIAIEQHRKRRKLYHEFCRFYTKSDEIFARAKWKGPTRVSCLPNDTVSMLSFMPALFFQNAVTDLFGSECIHSFLHTASGCSKTWKKAETVELALRISIHYPRLSACPSYHLSLEYLGSVTVKAASGAQRIMNVDKYC